MAGDGDGMNPMTDLGFLQSRSCWFKGHNAKFKVIYEFLYVDNTNHALVWKHLKDIKPCCVLRSPKVKVIGHI